VIHFRDRFARRVTNVVFMGMGEPLLNLPEVSRALRFMNEQLGIGRHHITISTVGIYNGLPKLADQNLGCGLAVSLHAPNQALREQIIPSARTLPLETLMEDCMIFRRLTNCKVTFEYTLLAGVNDRKEHAEELAHLLGKYGLKHHVNLIPWNKVEGLDYKRPSRNAVFVFQKILTDHDVPCTIRETRGLEASAACGQLRNDFVKAPLKTGRGGRRGREEEERGSKKEGWELKNEGRGDWKEEEKEIKEEAFEDKAIREYAKNGNGEMTKEKEKEREKNVELKREERNKVKRGKKVNSEEIKDIAELLAFSSLSKKMP